MSTKIRPIEITFYRSSGETYVWVKSEVIENEARKYAQGNDDPDTYYIPIVTPRDSHFIFNVPSDRFGSDEVYRALRTKGLGEGLKIPIRRVVSDEMARQIMKSVGEIVKAHVANFLSAYKISLVMEIEESVIKWTSESSSNTRAQ